MRAYGNLGISAPPTRSRRRNSLIRVGMWSSAPVPPPGKSLAFQLPIIAALHANPNERALYLSPTKALGHDQLRAPIRCSRTCPSLADAGPCAYDGDAPEGFRRFARERSRWLFSNPDMIHRSLLRNHARWAVFLRGLRWHRGRRMPLLPGIFGSNVAMVLRRLLRLCEQHSPSGRAGPTVIFASATTASPGRRPVS